MPSALAGLLWATGITTSLAFQATRPIPTQLKVIHSRIYAQALTVGALLGAAGIELFGEYHKGYRKSNKSAERLNLHALRSNRIMGPFRGNHDAPFVNGTFRATGWFVLSRPLTLRRHIKFHVQCHRRRLSMRTTIRLPTTGRRRSGDEVVGECRLLVPLGRSVAALLHSAPVLRSAGFPSRSLGSFLTGVVEQQQSSGGAWEVNVVIGALMLLRDCDVSPAINGRGPPRR